MDLKWFRREAEKHVPNEANRHVGPTVGYCGTCGGECRYKGPLSPAPMHMRITGPEMIALLDVAEAAMRQKVYRDQMKACRGVRHRLEGVQAIKLVSAEEVAWQDVDAALAKLIA